MAEGAEHFHDRADTPVASAVRDMLPVLDIWMQREDLSMAEVESEFCLLGYRVAVQRQRESLDAGLRLAESAMGHIAVGFVRPACEEFLWLKYLASLDIADATVAFVALGNHDALRSLVAVKGYKGTESLVRLGFPRPFVDAADGLVQQAAMQLKDLKSKLGWDGGKGPTVKWIASAVGELPLYEYLYAASSRAVHFSAGEALRRGWFDSAGRVSVKDVDHRVYLSDFALSELLRLFTKTLLVSDRWLDVGQTHEPIEFDEGDKSFEDRIAAFNAIGTVPLVWVKEYELIWTSGRKPGTPT